MTDSLTIGQQMHALARELFPIARSITGAGLRESLRIIRAHIPDLVIHEIPSGTKCYDWTVPDEWNIRDAYIVAPDGRKFAEFCKNNLHIVGYSEPVDKIISLSELEKHLYTRADLPQAIPYVTSYHKRRWGFCISHEERANLIPGDYRVFIDSTLEPGALSYGELVIPGATNREIFLSCNLCHPSMGNNELSGPLVVTFLAKWLLTLPNRRFTYRAVFVPETIGSIAYLSRNLSGLRERVDAGFVVTCIGDNGRFSYLPSRLGATLADRVALHVLGHAAPDFRRYSFIDRGSDERQYCSPGVDLPVASIMRSKYGEYPEYHTSLDNLEFLTPVGLQGGYEVLKLALMCLEGNERLKTTVICEPKLDARGLFPDISFARSSMGRPWFKIVTDILAYCDGDRDLLDVAERIQVPMWSTLETVERLKRERLLKSIS